MTDDAQTSAALIDAPVAPAGVDPALTHEDVQRIVDTSMTSIQHDVEAKLRESEARIASTTDARLSELESRIKQDISAALQPIKDDLKARTTADQVRAITDERIRPIQEELGTIRKDTEEVKGLIGGLARVLEGLSVGMTEMKATLTAWTAMRTTQDEQRNREIGDIRDEVRSTSDTLRTHISAETPVITNMHNDMYGMSGGQVGIVARVQQDHDLLTRIDQALTDLASQWTRARDEDKSATSSFSARLAPVEAFVTAEQAKRVKMREWFGKISAFMAKSLWNKILVLIAGGLGLTVVAGAFGLMSEDVVRAIIAFLGG